MKKQSFILALPLAALTVLALAVVSCSDDDDYNSVSPRFSDIVFTPSEIFPGERVTATAVQSAQGNLLDRTEYRWSVSGTDVAGSKAVIYDKDKSDPIFEFTAPKTPGQYTLKFNAEYNISGKSGTSSSSEDIKDGSVEYTSGPFHCYVAISKRFRVTDR